MLPIKYKYVLQDHSFAWLKRLSTDSVENSKKLAERYLCYPRGLIRGALHNLGLETKVSSSIAINGNAFACTLLLNQTEKECENRLLIRLHSFFYRLFHRAHQSSSTSPRRGRHTHTLSKIIKWLLTVALARDTLGPRQTPTFNTLLYHNEPHFCPE